MPIYEAKCGTCGNREDVFRPVARCKDMPDCCGKPMTKVFSPINVIEDMKPYKSVVTGEWITSRSQHKQHLKQHDLVEVGNEKLDQAKKPKKDPKLRHEIEKNLYQAGVVT